MGNGTNIHTLRQHILVAGIIGIGIFASLRYLEQQLHEQYFHDNPHYTEQDVFIARETWQNRTGTDISKNMRNIAVQQFFDLGFMGWNRLPLAESTGILTSDPDDRTQAVLTGDIYIVGDSLDEYIDDFVQTQSEVSSLLRQAPFLLHYDTRSTWEDIFLFTDIQQLSDLGYTMHSHRVRANSDDKYRRENIMTAFQKLGNTRLLLPGDDLLYLRDIEFDEKEQETYQSGYSIILDEEQLEYGGGLCGGSTALYQGMLTNTNIDIGQRRSHSKRYDHLYSATINGEEVTTPGLDSTVYQGHIDLHATNTSSYPIILSANYDGTDGGREEVFTLGYGEREGSFDFVDSYGTTSAITLNGTGVTVQGGCYTRNINNEERKSCYKEVK